MGIPVPPGAGDSGGVLPGDLDYRYDRRVDGGFLALFDAGGPFRTLTEYAREGPVPSRSAVSPEPEDRGAARLFVRRVLQSASPFLSFTGSSIITP